jgi:hypothetical protein
MCRSTVAVELLAESREEGPLSAVELVLLVVVVVVVLLLLVLLPPLLLQLAFTSRIDAAIIIARLTGGAPSLTTHCDASSASTSLATVLVPVDGASPSCEGAVSLCTLPCVAPSQ